MFVSYIGFDTFKHNNPEFDSTWEDDYNEIFDWDSWSTDTKLFYESLEMNVGEQRVSLKLVEELLYPYN
jgi:hypothetical protein